MNKIFSKLAENSLFKKGALFAFFSFLNSGINFLLLLILARFISASEYGKLNLFNTFITLFATFISLNAVGIIAVDFFSKSKQYVSKLLNTVFLLTTISFLVFSLLLSCFTSFFENILGLNVEYIWFGLLICYFQVFITINLDIWRLEERVVSYGLYSLLLVFINFVGTLILVVFFNKGWVGRMYTQLFVGGLFAMNSFYILIKRKYIKFILPSKNTIKQALSFGVPLIPHSTSLWIRQGFDRYIINYFYLSAQVGIYSFAYNFANIINIIGLAFNATNSVFVYKTLSLKTDESKNVLKRQIVFMSILFVVSTLLIYVFTLFFIPYFFPKYNGSIIYLFPLCLSAFFQSIYYLFVNYIFYFKKTKILMLITSSCSLLHVILALTFTRYSILYTAYITLFINFLITLAVYLYSRHLYKII